MADLYSLVHRTAGSLSTFATYEEAERELLDVLRDEPEWAADLWIEPFEVVTQPPGS